MQSYVHSHIASLISWQGLPSINSLNLFLPSLVLPSYTKTPSFPYPPTQLSPGSLLPFSFCARYILFPSHSCPSTCISLRGASHHDWVYSSSRNLPSLLQMNVLRECASSSSEKIWVMAFSLIHNSALKHITFSREKRCNISPLCYSPQELCIVVQLQLVYVWPHVAMVGSILISPSKSHVTHFSHIRTLPFFFPRNLLTLSSATSSATLQDSMDLSCFTYGYLNHLL